MVCRHLFRVDSATRVKVSQSQLKPEKSSCILATCKFDVGDFDFCFIGEPERSFFVLLLVVAFFRFSHSRNKISSILRKPGFYSANKSGCNVHTSASSGN